MAVFLYKGIDGQGSVKEGTISAVTEDVAINSLQRRGLIISEIKNVEDAGNVLSMNISIFEKVKSKDLVILSRQLATLFDAQVSALRIFRLLAAETENPKLGRALNDIAESIQGGSQISDALAKFPDIFTDFYVSMVRAGEESGRLDETFIFLADYLDRAYEITSKATNALIYPAFIIVTFITVMALMLTLVIPKISGILIDSGQDIPVYTKFVIAISDFIVNYGVFLLIALAIGGYFLYRYSKTDSGAEIVDQFKLSIPYVGDLYEKLYLSRLADNLNTMLKSGIPMVRALDLTKNVVSNKVYQLAMLNAAEKVKGGSSLSDSFEQQEVFPSILIQLIRVGEETGSLGEILGTLAKFYNREVTNAVDTLVGLIEPVMIVALSVGVGFLLASVLIPIYNISSSF